MDPNDRARHATEKLATIQEDRVSMLGRLKPIPGRLMRRCGRGQEVPATRRD
jgi:hypothetical protein